MEEAVRPEIYACTFLRRQRTLPESCYIFQRLSEIWTFFVRIGDSVKRNHGNYTEADKTDRWVYGKESHRNERTVNYKAV